MTSKYMGCTGVFLLNTGVRVLKVRVIFDFSFGNNSPLWEFPACEADQSSAVTKLTWTLGAAHCNFSSARERTKLGYTIRPITH